MILHIDKPRKKHHEGNQLFKKKDPTRFFKFWKCTWPEKIESTQLFEKRSIRYSLWAFGIDFFCRWWIYFRNVYSGWQKERWQAAMRVPVIFGSSQTWTAMTHCNNCLTWSETVCAMCCCHSIPITFQFSFFASGSPHRKTPYGLIWSNMENILIGIEILYGVYKSHFGRFWRQVIFG